MGKFSGQAQGSMGGSSSNTAGRDAERSIEPVALLDRGSLPRSRISRDGDGLAPIRSFFTLLPEMATHSCIFVVRHRSLAEPDVRSFIGQAYVSHECSGNAEPTSRAG